MTQRLRGIDRFERLSEQVSEIGELYALINEEATLKQDLQDIRDRLAYINARIRTLLSTHFIPLKDFAETVGVSPQYILNHATYKGYDLVRIQQRWYIYNPETETF